MLLIHDHLGLIPGPGMLYFRCKNLALNITDCVSLCLSDKSLLSGGYARGSKISHTGGKSVTCHELHILA